MWNPSTCDFECNKACNIEDYLNIKNCLCKKCLIGILVLACENEILITIKTLLENKTAIRVNNFFIHTISLIILCTFLLTVVFISCYFHFTKHRLKQKHLLLYYDTSNKLKQLILIA